MGHQFKQTLNLVFVLTVLLLSSGLISETLAQSTAFTYQGRLQDAGTNANGAYDFQFTLWDSLSGGSQQPQPSPVTVTKSAVAVVNGIFTVQLDFGANAFPGADRFLETSVRLAGSGSFTLLSPRQPLTSTPYAVRSLSSANADVAATATNATQLGGVAANQYVVTTDTRLSDSRAPTSGSANYIQNVTAQQPGSNFNISGDGTAGGTLTGNIVKANQYNVGSSRVLATPSGNVYLGAATGNVSTSNFNTFLGSFAGTLNTTGEANTFVGHNAGNSNTIGSQNTFAGVGSGFLNASGSNNSFFGYSAGLGNTSGSNNSFFGQSAGSGGSNNSAFGGQAGQSSTGSSNSFFGVSAGSKTSGNKNSFFGMQAGEQNVVGESNAFFGEFSGNHNTSGNANTFIGANSGGANIDGFGNSFVGYLAGSGNTSGIDNVFVGVGTGPTNKTGSNNTLIGNAADVGANNLNNATAIGANARVTANNSLVLGSINGVNGATADTNVGIGTTAPSARLHVVGTTGLVGNVGIGTIAPVQQLHVVGNGLFTGSLGIGVTSPAVALEVQRNSTIASDWQTGQLRISGASDPNMQLSVGYDTSSNLGVIQAGQASVAFKNLSLNPSGGNVGVGTTSATFKLQVNGETRTDTLSIANYVANNGGPPLCANTSNNRVALCTSSLRYKENVQTFRGGLDIIQRLRPISFTWKEGRIKEIGLGAEEVDKVEPLLTFRNPKGQVEGVRYDQLSAVFINAFKEQQAQIQQQQAQLNQQAQQIKQQEDQASKQRGALAAQQQELNALKKLVCRSHPRATVCR